MKWDVETMEAVPVEISPGLAAPVWSPDEPDPVLQLLWEEVRRSEAVRPNPRQESPPAPGPRFRRD